jgi:aminobenzoyl-glutamate transport protein
MSDETDEADEADEADEVEPEVAPEPKRGGIQKLLDGIERVGNKVPHPAIIFLGLCVLVIVLSAVLAAFDVKVTYETADPPTVEGDVDYAGTAESEYLDDYLAGEDQIEVHEETTEIESLLSRDGIAFLFSSFVDNFAGFGVVAVSFIAMMGVGVAEKAGLMGALIRRLVSVAGDNSLTFIIVLVGGLSSVATDAGYLILIPLAAAAFYSVGRNPLTGLAAAYAGVSVGFAVNVLLTPLDGLLTEITNEAIHLADPDQSIDLTANLWFAIASTIFVAIIVTVIASRVTEPGVGADTDTPVDAEDDDGVPEGEARGLRMAGLYTLVALGVIVLLCALPDGPLRNPDTGAIFNDSPLMDSLVFIITMLFLIAGLGFGRGAKTLNGAGDAIAGIEKAFAGLASLIFLLLLISQFIAYFNFSNMPTVVAVKMADFLERADVGAVPLLIGFIFVIFLLDIIIPGALPKWAIFAPIFVPLFIRLDVAPQTVLAAYRVGDSPMNVITPLMVYLPFIVIVAQRYRKDAGVGTIISLMIPYTVIVAVTWVIFFVVWFLLGIPMGPGYPASL